jgi:hypothetical protein
MAVRQAVTVTVVHVPRWFAPRFTATMAGFTPCAFHRSTMWYPEES